MDVALFSAPPASAFDVGGSTVSARAQEIFDILQDRHLPITPSLACSLAKLEGSASPAAERLWGQGYRLASTSLGLAGKMGNAPAWQRMFPIFVQAVVEPILRRCAARSGQNTLTTRGNLNSRKSGAAEYSSECRSIESWVVEAMSEEVVMGKNFWIGAGVALLGGFRKEMAGRLSRMRHGKTVELPFLPDLQLAKLIYGIEPELAEDRIWNKNLPRPNARSKRLRVGIRPREGGVTGVLHTRRDRDIADALPSAFVVPEEIRLIKLMEEGFMITHRPPHRRPERDLLSMTMSSVEMENLDAAYLIRAAWVDAAIRLRIILSNMSMTKTELGFAYIRAAGTLASAMSLENNPPKKGLDATALKGSIRRASISTSGLFPNMFETGGTPKPLKDGDLGRTGAAAVALVKDACHAQKALVPAKSARPNPVAKRIDPDEYANTCLIEAAPSVVRGDETVVLNWRDDRRDLLNRYGFDRGSDVFFGKILCPPILKPGKRFVVCSDDRKGESEIEIPDKDTEGKTISATIGALSTWMITQNILAALNG